MSSSGPIVEARGLTKRFDALTAVDAVDFAVERGECFGFLGPNGAGKTSTIRMITCVSPLTAGYLRVLGLDPGRDARKIKARLGVVPQDDNLDPDLTVIENLLAYARYFDLPRATARDQAWRALHTMALEEKAKEPIDNLSGGMKRRLTVARALVSWPELLVLDEPTTGLDPQARHLFWQKLRQLKREGMTMLLTTHYMDEAAHLCDRVVIMDRSRIIASGTPAELVARYIGEEVVEVRLDMERRQRGLDAVRRRFDGFETEETEEIVYLYARDGRSLSDVEVAALRAESADVSQRRATLEDVFLRLTGRALNE